MAKLITRFNLATKKLTHVLTPGWTLITMLAAIIYITYLAAAWAVKQENKDIAIETRVDALEANFVKFAEKQDKILFILLSRRNKDEMVD